MAVALPEYIWLLVLGAIGAFIFGFGTGSNDVANAFGTSVGSRTLTLKQAVCIAVIFEFTGALVLGRTITDTISGGIADVTAFAREPEVFAYGMMVALFVGGLWQIAASYMELNVSATHSIIGAIIGFAMVYSGPDAVVWAREAPRVPGERRPFPPVKGVVPIVLSWFVSPLLTGATSALIFCLCRLLVLRRRHAFRWSFLVLPPLVMLTVWVNVFFVLTKGAAKTIKGAANDWSDHKAAWVAAIVAACCSVLAGAVVVPILWARIHALEARAQTDAAAARSRELDELEAASVEVPAGAPSEQQLSEEQQKAVLASIITPAPLHFRFAGCLHFWSRMRANGKTGINSIQRAAMRGMEVDIHKLVDEDPIVAAIHANAEPFDPRAEQVFSYLQVFSAICVIFAHGAAEVGYMTGPLGAIWQVVSTGVLKKKTGAPLWVVLVSAFGLVFGLATYGYNVTRAVGTRMAKLTPSRGFAAELATSLVILIASQYGLPTSSSQCITGGIIGVALCEGRAGVNWRFLARTFFSWVSTVAAVALITAAIFAAGVFAPSKIAGAALRQYEDGVSKAAADLLAGYTDALRSTGYDTRNQADAFARSLATTRANLEAMRPRAGGAPPAVQTVFPWQMLGYLETSLALFQPALQLNASSEQVCPAVGADVCTQPPTGSGAVTLTPAVYGQSALPLDTKKQGATTCTRAPCNQA